MEKDLCFISVIGHDRKGIIARIASFLYEYDINTEDVSQKIMNGYFVMTMLVDMTDSPTPLETVRQGLSEIGDQMALKIQIQSQNIFDAMHRV